MTDMLIQLSEETTVNNFRLVNVKNGLICTLEGPQGKELLKDLKQRKKYEYYRNKYGLEIDSIIKDLIIQGFIQVGNYNLEQTMSGLCMVLSAQDTFYQLDKGNLYYDMFQRSENDSKIIGLIGINGFSNSYHHNISFGSVQLVRESTREIADLSRKNLVGDYEVINCIQIKDYGDLGYTIDQSIMEKRISDIGILLKNKNIMPIYIGGDHSVTYFLLNSYIKNNPIQIVQIDAHKDMGYQRGNKVEHGSIIRKLSKNNNVKKIIQLGIRGPIEASEINDGKVIQCNISEVKNEIIANIPVYLTIDSDGFDPALNPAVNYPLFEGLTLKDFSTICEEVSRHDLVGIDIVEYNAENDTSNKLGAHFIGQIILEILRSIGESDAG